MSITEEEEERTGDLINERDQTHHEVKTVSPQQLEAHRVFSTVTMVTTDAVSSGC